MLSLVLSSSFFFFNDTATTEIYTLSLHDALPTSAPCCGWPRGARPSAFSASRTATRGCHSMGRPAPSVPRSEEHTSELQSQFHLVCRLLLEKKNKEYQHNQLHMCGN